MQQHVSLFVAGMGCRRCVREVTARLRDVPGVETVSADAARSVLGVSGTMKLRDVLAAFGDTSFSPTVLPVTATTGDPRDAPPDHPSQPDRPTE
jgi:copper chaperone CopZ